MATVYKIEIEGVSDWTNFTPEFIEKQLEKLINNNTKLTISEIKVERVA